jgi:hypothetical protein
MLQEQKLVAANRRRTFAARSARLHFDLLQIVIARVSRGILFGAAALQFRIIRQSAQRERLHHNRTVFQILHWTKMPARDLLWHANRAAWQQSARCGVGDEQIFLFCGNVRPAPVTIRIRRYARRGLCTDAELPGASG